MSNTHQSFHYFELDPVFFILSLIPTMASNSVNTLTEVGEVAIFSLLGRDASHVTMAMTNEHWRMKNWRQLQAPLFFFG